MSQQGGAEDTEWLAESLSAVLEADPEAVTQRRGQIRARDDIWAGLMGPAGMSFTPADFRVDDIQALIVGLFDMAFEEWLEPPGAVDECPDEEDEAEEFLASEGAEFALSNDCLPVDDRTTEEALWSLLVDNWWRAAPPFAPTTQ